MIFFFFSLEQICLATKLVTCFIYKTNNIFNIKKFSKFLFILIEVLNTRKIFLFILWFIILEIIALFKFVKKLIYNLFFSNTS